MVASLDHPNGTRRKVTGWTGLLSSQGERLVLLVVALAILVYQVTRPVTIPNQPGQSRNTTAPPAHLHVLIPASNPDVNLCKVLLSAAILGYPSPVVINWNQTFADGSLVEGGSHLAKIAGVHEYLASLGSVRDDDLVLMIDGYDVWMQLRPQTLIDRYFQINQRADARIGAELGAAGKGVRQEIVFGTCFRFAKTPWEIATCRRCCQARVAYSPLRRAMNVPYSSAYSSPLKLVHNCVNADERLTGCQKRCWPWTQNDPPCYAVPQSELPKNIYGSRTDTAKDENGPDPFVNFRPRFLNSGMGMGNVRAMRKLFGQALEQAKQESNFGSDQYILSHIYGDQEVWREAVRRDALKGAKSDPRVFDLGREAWSTQHIEEVRAKAARREDGNFEFGIGVDFGSEIVLNTVFAEDDTAWLTHSKPSGLLAAESKRGITSQRSRLGSLADDIETSLPPFWTYSDEQVPRWTGWRDVSLLRDVYTGNVPAVIHHNAHRDGLKSRRETWWPLVFFQRYARILLDAHIYSPISPFAVSGYDNSSVREWWPYEIWKGGARSGISPLGSGDEDWVRFDDICRDHHQELFRDERGTWELPESH